MSAPFTTPESVVEGYRTLSQSLDPEDTRGLFAQVYLQISEEMLVMFQKHEFKNETWVKSLMVNYANLYRQAFYFDQINDEVHVPISWQLALGHKELNANDPIGVLFLASINAHVNRDLPYALIETQTNFKDKSVEKDFGHIAAAFDRRMPMLWQLLEQYEHCFRNNAEKRVIIAYIHHVMTGRRKRSWHQAMELANKTSQELPSAREELERFSVKQYFDIRNSWMTKLDQSLCEATKTR